ncbi:substrate-binding domain-containing protein [Hankyongella ginsenosidimutans]|uniref:substrate-binding domain-containing protein n=1 Tax=Hankyongella ginsenosidimutans TaxID=1763828 RepID=UPI00319E4597
MQIFCSGLGDKFPDITNASRRIKKSEVELCAKNGVGPIVEIQVGLDGIALAQAKPPRRSR